LLLFLFGGGSRGRGQMVFEDLVLVSKVVDVLLEAGDVLSELDEGVVD
jgi:hypothetical protein